LLRRVARSARVLGKRVEPDLWRVRPARFAQLRAREHRPALEHLPLAQKVGGIDHAHQLAPASFLVPPRSPDRLVAGMRMK